MPLYLEPRNVVDDLEGFESVLIVSCPICPPMSLAMREKTPFIEFFKHGLKTAAFEDYISSIRESLESRGVHTDVLTMLLPCPLMCLWTKGQRERLVQRAKDYEAVLVLGCNSATQTATDALKDSDCHVIQAMRMKSMANATTKFRLPMTIEFDKSPPRKKQRTRRGARPGTAAEDDESHP
jgi:hypothetical protein